MYIAAQLARAVLILALTLLCIAFIFPLPGLVLLGGTPVVLAYIIGVPALIVGIALLSVVCTKYASQKPVSSKKAEHIYGIIGISLIVAAVLAVVAIQVFISLQ